MSEEKSVEKATKGLDFATIISTLTKIPGVRISREAFLREAFQENAEAELNLILEKGPIEAGVKRDDLKKKASRIVKGHTAFASSASFVAGLPGGIAMAATIPADVLQFYAVALRMAQELAYLYGEKDLWVDATDDYERVYNQLLLYCGVMLGASGAAQAVRIMSAALAKQALSKLPRQALTKTFYYPVIKAILKFFGISLTKNSFAKGVAKALPVVGGFISGGITLASMLPMGKKLTNTLDKAHFDYDEDDFKADMDDITTISAQVAADEKSGLEEIEKAKRLLDEGSITEEEFFEIKSRIISQM